MPKEVAFPETVKDVEITAIGNKRVIAPASQSWDEWFNEPGVSTDFMTMQGTRRKVKRVKEGMRITDNGLGVKIKELKAEGNGAGKPWSNEALISNKFIGLNGWLAELNKTQKNWVWSLNGALGIEL